MLTLVAQRAATTPIPEVVAETLQTLETIAVTDFSHAFATTQMKFIAILLAADVILGIAAAIASRTFNFNKLGTFMATGVLPYMFGFAVVEIFASGYGPNGQMFATVVFVAIILNLLGSIISNLANLGVNMPPILKKTT